jgi:hypothetical protein
VQGLAELVGDELAARERLDLLLDVGLDVEEKLAAAFTMPRVRKAAIREKSFFMVSPQMIWFSVGHLRLSRSELPAPRARTSLRPMRGLAAIDARARLRSPPGCFLLGLHLALHDVVADQHLQHELALEVAAALADLGELLLDALGVLLGERLVAAKRLEVGLVGVLARLPERLLRRAVVRAQRAVGLDLPALLLRGGRVARIRSSSARRLLLLAIGLRGGALRRALERGEALLGFARLALGGLARTALRASCASGPDRRSSPSPPSPSGLSDCRPRGRRSRPSSAPALVAAGARIRRLSGSGPADRRRA